MIIKSISILIFRNFNLFMNILNISDYKKLIKYKKKSKVYSLSTFFLKVNGFHFAKNNILYSIFVNIEEITASYSSVGFLKNKFFKATIY